MSHKNKFHGKKFAEKNMNQENVTAKEAEELKPDALNSEVEEVEPEEVNVAEENAEDDVNAACSDLEKKVAELQEQLDKEKKEYLFLMAEFDNFRKRTLKEKSEIIKNAGENVLKGLLPIMDDFERGIKAA